MSARKLRKVLLDEAELIIQHYIATARGEDGPLKKTFGTRSEEKMKEVWDAVLPMIHKADDTTEGFDAEGSAAKAALSILEKLSKGEVTPDEAKKMMEVVSQVFDTTELPALIEKLSDMEKA